MAYNSPSPMRGAFGARARASDIPASARKTRVINSDKPEVETVSFDKMWTRMGARRGKKRRSARIRTAVEEWDGSRWADFAGGYRDAETLRRLLHRLPKAAKYRSDRCEAYSVPPSDATRAALSALGAAASRSANERRGGAGRGERRRQNPPRAARMAARERDMRGDRSCGGDAVGGGVRWGI